MRNQYLKTLWMLRFIKIKNNEEEAAWKYQQLLDEAILELGLSTEVIEYLTQLVREERAHSKMADELISICLANHPEFEALGP